MPENEDKIKKLYDTFVSDGYDMESEEDFRKNLSDSTKRKAAYDALVKDGYEMEPFEEFENNIGFGKVEEPQTEQLGEVEHQIEEEQTLRPWQPTENEKAAMKTNLQRIGERTQQTVDRFNESVDNIQEYGLNPGLQTKESKMQFNQDSGKVEKTYLTPAGNRYNSKSLADTESFRYRQAADMTVSGQLRRAHLRLQELKARQEERAAEVHKEWEEETKKNTAPLAFLLAKDTYVPRQQADKEKSALDVAIRQTEELIKDLEEQKDRENGVDVGFWRGFGRVAGDFRTWDFGMSDLKDAMTLMNADGLKSNTATEGEREAHDSMMGAIHEKQQAEERYGGNADFWNRAGVMAGYMPSFMLDFVLTGGGFEGLSAFSKGSTKAATRVIGKETAEKMAQQGFKSYIKENGIRGLGQYATDWTIKALGTTADDLLVRAPLMTNTIQAGKTATDIVDRKLGDVVIDENGNYDFSNDKTWGSAIWQGEANAIIENYSEMFGAHLDPVFTLDNMGKLANVIGAKRLGTVFAKADASALNGIMGQTQQMFNKMGVSDYVGEVSEEYYGQLWRTMLNLDDAYQHNPDGTRTNLFATGQFHGDIWGGMALSMGLMGAGKHTLSAANYASMKHGVNKADAKVNELLGKEIWEPLKVTLDLTTNENIGEVAELIASDKDFTNDEKAAVLGYMEKSLNLRGFNLASVAKSRGGIKSENEQQANDSYLDGYNVTGNQEMNDAKNLYEYHRQQVENLVDKNMLAMIEENPIDALEFVTNNEQWNSKEKSFVIDYINAKQVYNGMIQRVRDDVNARVEQSNAMIDARINRKTGMIQGATMKQDDRRVYVLNGNLIPYADGSGIDITESDNSIIIRDADTGVIEQVSPEAILSIDDVQDPYEQKELAEQAIVEQFAREAADKIDGVATFNPGDTFTISGEDGSQAQVQVVANEQGIVDNGDGTVNVSDGVNIFPIAKETIQQQVDVANIARVAEFEKQRALENGQSQEELETNSPEYAPDYSVTLRDAEGNIIHGTIAYKEGDETFVVDVDKPIGGKYAPNLTRQELNEIVVSVADESGQVVWERSDAEKLPENENKVVEESPEMTQGDNNVLEEGITETGTSEVRKPTAMERIPKDEQGNPLYEQADADDAFDAIMEEAGGESDIAVEILADIVKEKEAVANAAQKALKEAQEAKPDMRKGSASPTIQERIAAKKAAKEAISVAQSEADNANATLAIWQKIAQTPIRRKQEADAESRRIADEAAALRKAEEEKLRAEREEAERIEREALNGVPDMVDDVPKVARARGYRRINGHKVDRQEPLQAAQGKEVNVKFSNDVLASGNVVVIDASQLQPSHIQGMRNPLHFIDEAQPKERNDEASVLSARKIAENIRPEEITSSVTAYTGAPTVNERGEVIQGNSRSDALRLMWENHAEQATLYKQYLKDHAEEFGLRAEDIDAVQSPVLVNMLHVDDATAIPLGQYVAQDTESGGVERIKPKNALQRMGAEMRSFANLLLRAADDEMSFAGLVDANGANVLKWMNQRGFISPTQYKSAFDSKGSLTPESKNDLRGIMYQSIFKDGSTRLEEMFNALPVKAQRAILATAFRDYDSPNSERMVDEIQNSIRVYYALSQDKMFAEAKNFKETRIAIENWKRQYQMDDVTGESYLPADNFSNFALHLAAMYKGESQSFIQSTFNKLYDLIQGMQELNLFEQPDNTPRTLAQAIKETLNLDYDGQQRSNVLVGDTTTSQRGRQGSNGDAATGERVESGERLFDSAGRVTGSSRRSGTESEDRGDKEKENDEAEVIGRSMTADEAQDFIADMELDAEIAPEIDLTIENWDDLFGEDGIVSTPIGEVKMGENQFTKLMRQGRNGKLGMIKPTLEHPHAIIEDASEAKEGDTTERTSSYVFIRSFKKADGSRYYYFTSITVSKDGKEVVVSNQEKRRNAIANLLTKGKLVWKHADNVSNASDMAQGLYSSQGNMSDLTTEGTDAPQTTMLSESKDSELSLKDNELGEKIAEAEKETDTNPTEAQKEAGNYKKGHVQIGTFNVTIENPKGSVRSGIDAEGNKWETTMHNTYGYIRGTEGVDGDHIDVFLSDDIDGWNGRKVFVVDQYKEDGSFDEHKVMLGFNEVDNAEAAYFANYDKDWAKKHKTVVTAVNLEDFEKWIESSHRKTKAFAEYKSVRQSDQTQAPAPEMETIVSDNHSYIIEPAQYTTKRGKVLDMHLVRFETSLSNEQQQAAKALAKSLKGWYDREQRGFMMRSEEDAGQLVNNVMPNDEATPSVTQSEAKESTIEKTLPAGEDIFQMAERIAKEDEKRKVQEKSAGKVDNTGKEPVSLEQWKRMNGGERMAEAERQPLTREEIENAPTDEILRANALDYLDGNQGMVQGISYLKIYEDVRYSNGNSAADSGTADKAQLDETRTGSQQKLDGATGGSRGVSSELLDSEQGEGTVSGLGGHIQHSSDSEERNVADTGKGGDISVSGEKQRVGGQPVRSGERGGSRNGGGHGRNGKQGGRGRSNQSLENDRKRRTETERGRDSRDGGSQSIGEDLDAFLVDAMKEFDSVLEEFKRAGKEELSASFVGMSNRQMEVLPRLIVAGAKVGYAYIKKGVHNFAEWAKQMRKVFGDKLADAGLGENEIDAYIREMWKSKLPIDGETHTIEEWASILGKAELRSKISTTFEEKRKAQQEAENVPVKTCDRENIAATLPFLFPQQQDDVLKAETQFFDESHNDRDHAFGKGYMFTNGTGTGKTYTGLGIVKRFIKQGKGRILILTPSQTKVTDWIKDAGNLDIELNDLDKLAKAKEDGTTATTEKGEGAVITTFANFRQNQALLEDEFDLIVYDECHRLLENKEGIGTTGANQHYKISNRNENFAFLRLQDINPTWRKLKAKEKEFDDKRATILSRLQKENGVSNELTFELGGELPPSFHGNWDDNTERKFPEIANLRKEIIELNAKYNKDVKPDLEQQAKESVKRTKVVFLSATPFNTRDNLEYAEGYIFSYPEREKQDGYSVQSPRSQFYLEHFGAGYKWRYHRLENSGSNPEAVSKQEVEFSNYLQNTLQTMSGRIIDSPYDYSRDFPTVTLDKAEEFNNAMEELAHGGATGHAYYTVMGDYNYTSALFESMKVGQIIPRLKEHLARGRKAVIFHRRVESKNPIVPPFRAIFIQAVKDLEDEYDASEKEKKRREISTLRRKYANMLEWERTLDLRMPREQLADAFGKDEVLFFSGKESKKVKDKAVADFNNDDSGKNIIVIQETSGKEGISLHDTTGKHQRVLVTLALPQSPITALQIEGRIYRIGNKSNAIFEYPLLGLNTELMLFGQKFNQQVSTTENLALGSQARNLRESFARGVEEHSGNVDINSQGVGGKEFDAPIIVESNPFDNAVLDYYTNQKLTGKRDNREGIDYYPTPEPLGFMLNQWGHIGEGESVLEPSAGHGAIARYVPRENPLTAIEPSQGLFSRLQIKAGGNGRKFENTMFENYNVVNKHDVVLMNPPFGVGGRLSVDHVAKAFQHLEEGGRIVAIIPRGSTDKKFDKWYDEQKNATLTAEIGLPDIVFERAGTRVSCRAVVIDKITNETLRSDAASRAMHIDLGGQHYEKIEDFFEEIRDISVPKRTIDQKARLKKKAISAARELRTVKNVKDVLLTDEGINVSGRGVWASINWDDRKGDVLTAYLSEEYRRFKDNYDYALRDGQETREIVYSEMKALACKLAGMTEDEMQRYISQKAKGDTLYRSDELYTVNENPSIENEELREGDGIYNDDEISYENDPVRKMSDRSRFTAKQRKEFGIRERERMAVRVQKLSEKLHLNNVEVVTDTSILEGKKQRAKGFFSKSTGKITIVIPNHTSMFDVEQTLLHEAVAHYGLRELFGEHFDTFLDNVFNNADENIRKRIVDLAAKNSWDFGKATEEYLAMLAENMEFENTNASWWRQIKNFFLKMLHKIGFENFSGVTLTDNELRYILWRSYENLAEPGKYRSILGKAADIAKQYELKVGNYAETAVSIEAEVAEPSEDDTFYREASGIARTLYEDAVADTGELCLLSALARTVRSEEARRRFKHKFSESYFDYSRSVKKLQDAIEKATGKTIQSFENAWQALNAKSSVDSIELQRVQELYIEPLNRHIGKMIKGKSLYGKRISIDDVEVYLNALHGPERNRLMAEREAEAKAIEKNGGFMKEPMEDDPKYDKWVKWRDSVEHDKAELLEKRKDYAGLTALFGDVVDDASDVEALEDAARRYTEAFEKAVGGAGETDKLHDLIRKLNRWTLKKAYLSGLIGKEQYDYTLNMYENYVPLRGWHDDYAGDVYDYISNGSGAETLQSVMKRAYGRKSRAAHILGTMAAMANMAIVQGNKNIVAQKFMNCALNHADAGLLMVSKQWYEKLSDGTLKPIEGPELTEKMTAEEMQHAIEKHDTEMKERSKTDTRIVSNVFSKNFPYRLAKWQEREHSVRVMRNGVEYQVYVLGNPKAAEALNGLLNPDSKTGTVGKFLMNWMRFKAKVQTSLSPEFLISNFQRDVLTAGTGMYVKYGGKAGRQFAKNLACTLPLGSLSNKGDKLNGGGIFTLIKRYDKGTLDMNDDMQKWFKEFCENGGMTGISSITNNEEFERQLKEMVGRIRHKNLNIPRDAAESFFSAVEFMNKGIENATRFSVYMTLRQDAKSVGDAVFAAKEASVNFNMKGSGAWGNLWMRRCILYSNPALQALRMLGTWHDASKRRFYTAMAVPMVASFATALLYSMLGGGDGDDDNEWYALSEWNRYNYINVKNPAGNGYFHWSIPQEFRPAWALGQIVYDLQAGRVTEDRALQSMLTQVNNLSPMAFIAGGSDSGDDYLDGFIKAWTPTIAADFMDVYHWNQNFLGRSITNQSEWNKHEPEWQRAGKETPDWAVEMSRLWSEATGGSNHRRSDWDSEYLNPSAVYYLLEQQAGGVGSLITKISKMCEQLQDPDTDVEPRYVPFVSKFYVGTGDDYSKNRMVNDKFWMHWNEYQTIDYELSKNRSDKRNGKISLEEYEENLNRLKVNGDYDKWLQMRKYAKLYEYLLKQSRDGGEEAKKKLQELKRKAVEEAESGKRRKSK